MAAVDGAGAVRRPLGPFAFPTRSQAIQWLICLATVGLVASPLLPILWQSIVDRPLYDRGGHLTIANFVRLFSDGRFYAALENTVILAIFTTLLACLMGVALAVVLERTNVPGGRALRAVMLWPMYISQLVISQAWFIAYGPAGYASLFWQQLGLPEWNLYSLPGMILVSGVAYAPLVYLFCANAAKLADPSLEDAARSVGASSARVLFYISLPLMWPAIAYAGLLVFIGSIEILAVPLVFGRPAGIEVFTTYLYDQAMGDVAPDYGLLGAAAVLILITITALIVLLGRLIGNEGQYTTVRGKPQRSKLIELGGARWTVLSACVLYMSIALGAPLLCVVLRSITSFLTPLVMPWTVLTLDNFRDLWSEESHRRAIMNSIVIASVGGAGAAIFTTFIALLVKRSYFPFRRALEFVALYPRAMPGVMAGLGVFWGLLLVPFADRLLGSVWILVLAFTMMGIPIGYGAVAPALQQISHELDQSARASGADWWTSSTRIVMPIIRSAILGAFTLLFVSFMKEYTVALFLQQPGSEIIGTTMLDFWGKGDSGATAALALVQLAITALFIATVGAWLRDKRDV